MLDIRFFQYCSLVDVYPRSNSFISWPLYMAFNHHLFYSLRCLIYNCDVALCWWLSCVLFHPISCLVFVFTEALYRKVLNVGGTRWLQEKNSTYKGVIFVERLKMPFMPFTFGPVEALVWNWCQIAVNELFFHQYWFWFKDSVKENWDKFRVHCCPFIFWRSFASDAERIRIMLCQEFGD